MHPEKLVELGESAGCRRLTERVIGLSLGALPVLVH